MRIFFPLILIAGCVRIATAQQAMNATLAAAKPGGRGPESAWLDLRQTNARGGVQAAPSWVESVKTQSVGQGESATVFRIRVERPRGNYNILFVRLFFLDRAEAHPVITAWDESGSQLIRSGPLGTGTELENSESVMVPMHRASTIDIETPGDGSAIRGAFLQWMTSSELIHPANASAQESVPAPFAAATALTAPSQDAEQFGTVTAALADEAIRIGGTTDQAAVFNFDLETTPLLALLSFEIAAPQIDSPPEVSVNGQKVGTASLILPSLADPGYRGEMRAMTNQMRFQYTGWVRAQVMVPAGLFHSGTNEVTVVNGADASAAIIRATQVQLKYLWDKSDYILKPER